MTFYVRCKSGLKLEQLVAKFTRERPLAMTLLVFFQASQRFALYSTSFAYEFLFNRRVLRLHMSRHVVFAFGFIRTL